MNSKVSIVTMHGYDARGTREKAIEVIGQAARYIAAHAADFVAQGGSDEVTAAGGLDITIHVKVVDEAPTITVSREMFVLADEGDER